MLAAAESGQTPETPKPGDRAFARVTLELVASHRLALEAAADRATGLGLAPTVFDAPLAGEAATMGAELAATLIQDCARGGIPQPNVAAPRRCLIWGGETTVTLGPSPSGLGGRCQELALAAARVLDRAAPGPTLLAAGTDGGTADRRRRRHQTATWRMTSAGRDPARDLAAHDAYHALDAAGALFRPGLTGTNVMDVMIGVC
jgi:glycerate-2-kinase